MRAKRSLIIVLAALVLASAFALEAFAIPAGLDNITIWKSERAASKGGAPVVAQGGNISWMNVSVKKPTEVWQGFVGNLSNSGLILDDASGDRFYSWNLTNTSGEIYASRNASIYWYNIWPNNVNSCKVDEALTGKGSDRVSKTFIASSNTVNFSVGNILINSSSACAFWPFINSTEQTTTNFFENVILMTATGATNNTIYTGIMEVDGTSGFDTDEYNFQLIVPVNKTSGFTTYYLYAEVE